MRRYRSLGQRAAWFVALLGPIFLLGCGGEAAVRGSGAPFSSTWQADQGKSIAALEEKLRSARAPAATPIAVGVNESGLFGVTLPDGKRWSYGTSADTVPQVAGNVVVASHAGNLFALDAQSGKQLWRLPIEGRKLRGAADDGELTVVVAAGDNPGKSRFELRPIVHDLVMEGLTAE